LHGGLGGAETLGSAGASVNPSDEGCAARAQARRPWQRQCRTSRASTSSGGASFALAGRCAAGLRLGRRAGCVPLELGGTFGGT
jgi:hypothetical protein